MSPANAHHCPDCKAQINSDLRTCRQCGSDVGVWPESQRAPLILPGNPAFSADVVRKRISIPKIIGATALGASIIGAVLYYMPARDVAETQAIASASAESAEASALELESGSAVTAVASDAPLSTPMSTDSMPAFSYGDRSLTRTVPSTAPQVITQPDAPDRSLGSVRASAPPPRESIVESASVPPARAASISPDSRPSVTALVGASRTADPSADTSPSLSLAPILSNILNPGQQLQLRWTVIDQRTRRRVSGSRVEFTSSRQSIASVDSKTGLVVARSPGSTVIIIDGGSAGRITIRLTVSVPRPTTEVASATPTPAVTSRTTPPVASPVVSVSAPVAAPAAASPRTEMPDADDVRTMVDRFIRDVRRDAVRNAELTQFMADGADHRVTLVSGPTIISTTTLGVRVTFDVRFTKFDSGGRPVTRVSSIAMDVDRRNGEPTSSAVAIGSPRRP